MTRITTGAARDHRATPSLRQNGIGLGTGVLTADGELPVEYLTPGDRIVTFDRGLVRLDRVEVELVCADSVVLVRPAVLDPDGDGRAFILSARQQVLVRDWRARVIWKRPVALVEAAQLVDGAYIARLQGPRPVRLFRLAFEDGQHLVEIAGGTFQLASARRAANVTT